MKFFLLTRKQKLSVTFLRNGYKKRSLEFISSNFKQKMKNLKDVKKAYYFFLLIPQ